MSDTQSLTSVLFANPEGSQTNAVDDEDPFASPRLQAIFSQGVVVVEGPTCEKPTTFNPAIFTTSLLSNHQETVKRFSETGVQRDFATKAITEAANTTTCRYIFNRDKPVSISHQIATHLTKGDKAVQFLNRKFTIPSIKSEFLDEVASALSIYNRNLIEEIAIAYHIANPESNVEKQKTLDKLSSLAAPLAESLTNVHNRRLVYNQLLVASALEVLVTHQRFEVASFLQTTSLGITDSRRGGSFMRVDHVADTTATRLKSAISPASVAVATTAIYKLRYNQLQDVITYIFSKKVDDRCESKVNLLATLQPIARQLFIQHPEKLLQSSIEENFLTREEILHLFFSIPASNRMDAAKMCPSCNIPVQIQGCKVRHQYCEIINWLVKTFEFDSSADQICAPSYIYLADEMSTYAKTVINLDQQRKLTPLVARTEQDFRVVQLTESGQPKTLAHIGAKQVRVTNFPYQGGGTSSSHPYNLRK